MKQLVPIPTPSTAPYWEAAKNDKLTIQRCSSCERFYFYPRPFCPGCNSDDVEWVTVSGRAKLVSYTINWRPYPPFDPATPLVHALVELDEGPRMMSNIVGVEPAPAALPLDMELQVTFEERGELKIPMFTPRQETPR